MLTLGTREKNVIEVTDCFTVPHNETDQEVFCCLLARIFLFLIFDYYRDKLVLYIALKF